MVIDASAARKWRPPLALVIGGGLIIVLGLPLAGIVTLRWITPVFGWKISVTAVAIVLVIGTAIIGWVQWRLLLRPIRALSQASRDMGQGVEGHAPLHHYGTSEIAHLGHSVHDMAQRLTERHSALRAYTDHVTHELKSPITSLQAAVELLVSHDLSLDHRAVVLEQITQSTGRMTQLLNVLHVYGRAQAIDASGQTPLRQCAAIQQSGVSVFGNPLLPVAPDGANAIMTHFIENAWDAGADRVDICAYDGGVLIADTGSGIQQWAEPHVLTPFYTTKRDSGGTGMGLPIVVALLNHGGWAVDLWRYHVEKRRKYGGAIFELNHKAKYVPKKPQS